MAHRNQLPPLTGGPRPLLPAPSPQNTADGIARGGGLDGVDGSDGVQSKGSGKVMKRAKVTAVACQPCQRRKSKCDGQRPTCSACATKRTNSECIYDSAGDQRRTASLKEQIAIGEREIHDLRTIIEAMCADPSTVDLVRERLVADRFRRTQELAHAFRTRMPTTGTGPPPATGYSTNTTAIGFSGYPAYTGPSYAHPGFLTDGAAPSPTATAQSGWSSEVVSGEEQEEDFVFDQGFHQGPPSWP